MNIEKYQKIINKSKCQNPEQVKSELKNLLNIMEKTMPKNDASIKVYNILCGADALLGRYDTINRETIFAISFIEDADELRNYMLHMYVEGRKRSIDVPNMIVDKI